MILAWPLTTSAELAGVLRPGGHVRPDSALRTLRERGFGAEAISVVPRSNRGAHGRVVWYSSLMLDVARLARAGDNETAAAAHASATRLASHRAAKFVAEWLAENGSPDPDPAALDAATGGALTRLATMTSSARQSLLPLLRVQTFAGRVAELAAGSALIIDEDGHTLSVPTPMKSPTDWGDALVVVDIEELDGGASTLWVRAAFDPEADPNQRVPGGPHILTPAERKRLGVAVASAR